MRALVLLLLCVILLAVLQASYIVTEAKKHNEMRVADDAEGENKHEKKMRRKGKNGGKDTSSEMEIADDHVPSGYQVNDLTKGDPEMPSDQPASERSGRRERVSKEERLARKEERKSRKEERKERKEQRKAAKAERKEKKGNKQERNERKQEKAVKKAERKAERKNNRQQKKEERQQQQVSCTSDADCGEGQCCFPKRGGEMMCKANRKPRKAGKRCVTSCACEGDLACYSENPAPDAPQRPRNRQLGKCVAPSEADLTRGTILTAAPQETAPGA